jgi:hypothetical protein
MAFILPTEQSDNVGVKLTGDYLNESGIQLIFLNEISGSHGSNS